MTSKNELNILALQHENKCLRKEMEQLRSIISLIPGNLYWKDDKGIYQGCDNMASTLSLPCNHSIIGKSAYDFPQSYANEIVDTQVMEKNQEKTVEEIGLMKRERNAGT